MRKKEKVKFILLIALFSSTTWAGDFEDGNAAYVNGDYLTAVKKYKNAALNGNARAQHNLGWLYDEGQGVVQDYVEAVKWYKLAALQGNLSSQINLGLMYSEGRGVKQDYTETVKWYKLAAAQGSESAQFNLGRNYALGQGVKQDYVLAHMWTNLAAIKGDKDTIDNRNRIAAKMTPQQILDAQKLARECQARKFKNCD